MPANRKPVRFSCLDRSTHLTEARTTHYDLIVIGGGVTGAGIALDAATRGFKTLLIEKSDFAAGTSSKSTKLIHGGLRYLKQFEIGLVRETGTERAIVHRLAPHLVHPEKMLLPIVEEGSFGKWSASIAISVYDYLAGVRPEDRKLGLTNDELINAEPLIRPERLKGGMKYSEYRTDDARLTIALVKTAVQNGVKALNYCEFKEFIYDQSRVTGMRAFDHITEETVALKSRFIVSAAGPWVDQIREADGSAGGKSLHLTKGVHIVIDHKRFPLHQAVYFDAFDGRMIFAIPRGKVTYVGTSDTTYRADLNRVRCSSEDAQYLLNAVNNYFAIDPLQLADISSSWAGLRPLIHQDGKSPSELSRKDEIFESPTGLISIAGGKLTGYRRMAERIVNLLASRDASKFSQQCTTADLPLQSAAYQDYESVQQHIKRLQGLFSGSELTAYHGWYLVTNYGIDADQIVLDMENRGAGYTESRLIESELDYCLTYESVARPQDFLNRRTGRLYFDMPSARQFHQEVITTFARHFGWSTELEERLTRESWVELEDCTAFDTSRKVSSSP